MKKQWVKIVCIGLALAILMPVFNACSLFGGSEEDGTEVPVVEIKRVAPNNLGLPGITKVGLAKPEEGTLLVNENAKLWVPPGAVAEQTPVTITKIIQPPGDLTSTRADAEEVQIISDFYDLGPDSVSFDELVEITLFYSEEALPAGADENNIGPVYFDGQNWVPVERQLDTEVNSVTFQVNSFPGVIVFVAFGIQVGWPTILAAGAAIGLTTAVVGNVVTHPLIRGRADEYVTPTDPVVLKWAERTKITAFNPYKEMYLKDLATNPDLLKEFLSADHGRIQFENPDDASSLISPEYVRDWPLFDIMQKPADYFNNGMKGDCEDIAVAIASIFRHYGYPVKCVDGKRTEEGKTGGHAWAEIIIGGKPYYLGETGLLEPLDTAIEDYQLVRPTPSSFHGFAWDENGQQPYKEKWWVTELSVSIDESKAYPGGQAAVEIFSWAGLALDLNISLEDPNGIETSYSGKTDEKTGKYRMTIPFGTDAPTGVYILTAENDERMLVGVGAFVVQPVKIGAAAVTPKVIPGEELKIKVSLNYPLKAVIKIDGIEGSQWVTEENGVVYITLNIPEDEKLGPYTLVVRAPDYKISTNVDYTVWIPPTMKVSISPAVVAPGGVITLNVLIQPPQATRLTIRGYETRWMTGDDGVANPMLPVPEEAEPGVYEVVVEAPAFGLIATATYTVSTTPELNTVFNVGMVGMTLGLEGLDDEGAPWSDIGTWGGNFMAGETTNRQFKAFGFATVNYIEGTAEIVINLNDDLSRVTSGSFTFNGEEGQETTFSFTNISRDEEMEAAYLAELGLECRAYLVSGTDTLSRISSFSATDPTSSYTWERYWANDDCVIMIVLAAASEDELTELLNM